MGSSRRLVGGRLLEETAGRGADVVFDPVGGSAGEDALRCVASEGRFLCVGFAAGRWPDVNVAHMVGRSYAVLGVYAGAYTRDQNEHDHDELMALFERGELKSCVTRSVAFDDLPSALEEVACGDAIGKLVVAAAP